MTMHSTAQAIPADVAKLLMQARPDQLHRLLDDIKTIEAVRPS